MQFALVDLKFPKIKANREHTGGFGSFMRADGLFGAMTSKLKASLIELPIIAFAFSGAILRQAGHEVVYSDGQIERGIDVVIVASSMHCHVEEVGWVRAQRAKNPKTKFGFYGPFAQEKPEYFQADSDFIIGGELESAIFAFIDGKHDFAGTLNYGVVSDLTRLPFPDWEGMDHARFSYFPLLHQRPFFPMQATRGCAYNCDFCPYMVSQTKIFRRRDPEQVVAEMERNVRDYGMRSFLFRDICFTLNKKYARQIGELMIERRLDLEWACETRIDCLDEDLIDVLCRAGWRGVNIGIETGDNDILQASGKRNPAVAEQERMITLLKQKGVRINGFYMLGLVGDTPESMQRTIEYAKRLNTLGAQFCVMTPFPGTPLAAAVESQLLTSDYSQFNEYRPVVDIKTSRPEQVSEAHGRAFRDYYLRWDWLIPNAPKTVARMMKNMLS